MKNNNLHILVALTMLHCIIAPVLYADEICDAAIAEGKQKYSAGNYQGAKELFEYAQSECGSNYGNAQAWIAKCNAALTPTTLSVSSSSLSFGSDSGTKTITVYCNREWSLANTSSNMFTVTRNGNRVTIRCNANSTTNNRSDYFDIKSNDGTKSQRIHISQTGRQSTYLTLGKTSVSCSYSGATEYISVYCNGFWSIQYPTGTMYSASRYNDNSIKVVIQPNTTSNSRTDYFNVVCANDTIRVDLSQSGKSTANSNNSNPTRRHIRQMSAKINRVWVDHNVYKNGQYGMLIHVNFDCDNMRGVQGWCIAWFYNANGSNMKNYSANNYTNRNHNVGTWTTFTPRYDSSNFSDVELFIPNSAITGRGSQLYFQVDIQEYSSGTSLVLSPKHFFYNR